MAQMVNSLPAMQETQVRSLGRESPMEEKMATHSRSFAWKIPWIEEPGGLQSMGSQRIGHDWMTSTFSGVKQSEISYTYAYVHFFFFWDLFPPCKPLVPCAICRFLAITYFIYSSAYMSITISQFITPFNPLVTLSLFSTSVILLLLWK